MTKRKAKREEVETEAEAQTGRRDNDCEEKTERVQNEYTREKWRKMEERKQREGRE